MRRTMWVLVLTGWLGATAPGTVSAQDLERGWVPVREDLEVFLDPAAGAMRVNGTMIVRLEGVQETVQLDLAVNSRAHQVRFDTVRVRGAEVELNVVRDEYPNALMARVRWAEARKRGEEVHLEFETHTVANGRQLVVGPAAALASWVEGWYPVPLPAEGASLGGASQVAGATTFHLPSGWRAVSNGRLVSSTVTEGVRVEEWRTDRRLSRSFAAAPYTVLHESAGDLDVSFYLLSDDLPDPRVHVAALSQAIAAMEERWGDYPYPSYAVAEIPDDVGSFGASSEQGFIMVKPGFLKAPQGNLPLFAHEAAHGWWGNTVGADGPGSLLVTEALAQYGAVIAAERVWGTDGATEFLRFSSPGYVASQCARGYFSMLHRGEDKALSQLESGGAVDHALSDAKGHWMYHMLRRRVGDEVFFGTLRTLAGAYAGRAMTLDDIRAAFLTAAPEADLDIFFAQWLDRTGAPVLTHEWEATVDGLSLTVSQKQDGEPFDLWLEVGIEAAGGMRTERVHLREKKQSFQLAGAGEVRGVILDPRHELLIWTPEYGEAPVSGLPEAAPEPVAAELAALLTGAYEVEQVNLPAVVTFQEGQLLLSLGGRPAERLVHTGGRRFRSAEGFVVFQRGDDRAEEFVFVRDQGGTRRAVRRAEPEPTQRTQPAD